VTPNYELGGPAAPPMLNGELVFEAPWQGRAFGIACSLAEQGIYEWDDFRARLIEQIGSFDRDVAMRDPAPEYRYYEHFLRALEALLVERGLVAAGELESRIGAFAARPHGHDHRDHDHHHG
jgi:nitrile hydratase accessory protein